MHVRMISYHETKDVWVLQGTPSWGNKVVDYDDNRSLGLPGTYQ